jgi:hypothetical protein
MPWHHVIPKHEWKKRFGNLEGCNSIDNLVNLSLENHTQIHHRMGEEGSEVDRVVALRMMGQIGGEEGTRLAQSVANKGNEHWKGRVITEEYRQRMSLLMTGKRYNPHTKEARLNHSAVLMGQKRALGSKHSLESKIARSIWMTGKKRGPYKKRVT